MATRARCPTGFWWGWGGLVRPAMGRGYSREALRAFFGGEYIAKECSQYHTNEFVCIICLRRIRSMRVNTLDGVGVFLKLSVVVRATAFTFSVETHIKHGKWVKRCLKHHQFFGQLSSL